VVGGRRAYPEIERSSPDRGPLVATPAARRLTAALVLASLLAGGCGSGARQDAREPAASFTLAVDRAAFPAKQSIARPASMELVVRNTSPRTAPNIAVTVDSFYYTSHFPELASNKRPIWVVEKGPGAIPSRPVESEAISPPGGGQTAYVNTWALGPLAPGSSRTFRWEVVPVEPGLHTVDYRVAAGLGGKAKAELPSGGPVAGHFGVAIASVPPARHVNPNTGQVVPGRYPQVP
jgi:hypothetical protein